MRQRLKYNPILLSISFFVCIMFAILQFVSFLHVAVHEPSNAVVKEIKQLHTFCFSLNTKSLFYILHYTLLKIVLSVPQYQMSMQDSCNKESRLRGQSNQVSLTDKAESQLYTFAFNFLRMHH